MIDSFIPLRYARARNGTFVKLSFAKKLLFGIRSKFVDNIGAPSILEFLHMLCFTLTEILVNAEPIAQQLNNQPAPMANFKIKKTHGSIHKMTEHIQSTEDIVTLTEPWTQTYLPEDLVRGRVDRKGQYLCSRPLRAFSSEIGFSKLFFGVLRATTIIK